MKACKLIEEKDEMVSGGLDTDVDSGRSPNLKRSNRISNFKTVSDKDELGVFLCPVSLDIYCGNGETALHVAIRKGHRDVVR